ncbi:hypothetical protein Plano_0537 [Planococcus sp. PAMC 21323]|uniref:hypothetical protein n=1 Tax=Planococcus sp. PAMC 21323 TaxID=1526927 RepID=UPI00056FDB3E|nr:hypothetical protein [Planococcus sp. PAMC 21323]AIY04502.1 hypothetical protein Plano_0537 [Planococcus sp. PAMC 21323]
METKQKKIKTNDDYLYEEALSSLKELNQEVFLNNLNEQLKQFIQKVSMEVAELKSQIKDDTLITNSTLASVNSEFGSAIENFTDETKENLEMQDGQIRNYFSDFLNYLNAKLEETLATAQESNDLLIQNITTSIHKHEERFEQFNNRHDAIYQVLQSENVKFEHLVENFRDSTTQSIAVLKKIHLNWLSAIEELQSKFLVEIDKIQEVNKKHQTFIDQSNSAVIFELSQLKKNHERLEKNIEQHEQRQQFLKQETEQSLNQFKAFMSEQQKSNLETIFDQMRNERNNIETKLEEQEKLIKINQKTNNIFSTIICAMVIALIVLQFG